MKPHEPYVLTAYKSLALLCLIGALLVMLIGWATGIGHTGFVLSPA